MDKSEIKNYRLLNQHLIDTNFTKPEEVVSHLGAIQAQEYPGGLWSIGLRYNNSSVSDVEKAIAERKFVRTWPMRGTLHFVPTEDIRWMLKLLTPKVESRMGSNFKKAQLDERIFSKSTDLITKAILKNKSLTRQEFYKVLEDGGINTKENRGLYISGVLAQRGLTCFGPLRGKQPTFVLLDEWLPKVKELTREESIAKITLKYFTSHGPATIKDLMWWAGLTKAEVLEGIELNKDKLLEVNYEDKSFWMSSSTPVKIKTPTEQAGAYLLQAYDEFGIAYKERDEIFDPKYKKIFFLGNGYTALMMLDGEMMGIWKKNIKKNHVEIILNPMVKLSKKELSEFELAADKYTKFIGLERFELSIV